MPLSSNSRPASGLPPGVTGRRSRAALFSVKVPHGHWKTLTFMAALGQDRIAAPYVFDGPINGTSFLAYVRQFMVPTLKPGDLVIMDNLGSHKSWSVRAAIRAAGAKLFFLPPNSCDLNPSEQVFAKLKTLLRKAEETHHRGYMATHRTTPPMLRAARMRRLRQEYRIRFDMRRKDSSHQASVSGSAAIDSGTTAGSAHHY